MSIDYFTCRLCLKAFPDVLEYGYCGNCEDVLCQDCLEEMQDKYGLVDEDSKACDYYGSSTPKYCIECDPEIVRDKDIVEYFLDLSNSTREEVVNKIKMKRK